MAKIPERCPLGAPFLVYDTPNYYSFIHTFNSRPSLPQRGRNQQKRPALRQISLALVVDAQRGLPLYSRGYEGNLPDVVALGPSLAGMIRQFLPQQAPVRLTLVLDQGKVSVDNFKALPKSGFSFIAAIPAGWVGRLSQLPLKEYQPLDLSDGKSSKVYCKPKKKLGGIPGKLVMIFSPSFSRKQVRTLDLLQQKAEQKLLRLRASVRQSAERNRPRKETAVKGEIAKVVRQDRLKDFFCPSLHLSQGAVTALSWQWDRRKKREVKHRHLGQTVLFTDRQELAPQRMVEAYRSQCRVEQMFRLRNSRRPGLWWPAYHWTAGKLSVYALYCFLAMLMMRMVWLRLQERHLSLGVHFLGERLQGIEEALVVYANGAAQRVITERSPEQEELFISLH